MKKVVSLLVVLVLALAVSAVGQNFAPGSFAGWSDVQQFAQWTAHSTNAVASGTATMSLDTCYWALAEGPQQWFPLATNVKVKVIDSAGNSETVTITAVSTPTPSVGSAQPGYACSFTASFANAHSANVRVVSADGGLGEAINTLTGQGGTIVVTPNSGVTVANITGVNLGAYTVSVVDISGNATAPVSYCYNGTTYAACSQALASANGASMVPFFAETNVTLATGATTTAVGSSTFIPANSVILGVTGRVTTTITSACTGWEIGDTTTAARFTVNNTGLTAGTKATNTGAFINTGIATGATTGIWQGTAEALQITCAGGNPGAGAVRVTAFGFTITPAAQ